MEEKEVKGEEENDVKGEETYILWHFLADNINLIKGVSFRWMVGTILIHLK